MTALRCWARRAILALAAGLTLPAQAQTLQVRSSSIPLYSTALVGMVRDSSGRPVMGVELRLKGHDALLARTNDDGGFRIPDMPVGPSSISLRRLGFAPAVIEVQLRANQIDSLVISMAMLPTNLPEVAVEDEHDVRSKRVLARFWERRKNGFGSFMTRDEIENRNAPDFAELVRNIPGVRITSRNGRPAIRFARSSGVRDCPPQYVLNGIRIENGSPDEFAPEDVEALEIYAGPSTIPIEFQPRPNANTCGAVVIWTRIPG
jgi:hypothetical protein